MCIIRKIRYNYIRHILTYITLSNHSSPIVIDWQVLLLFLSAICIQCIHRSYTRGKLILAERAYTQRNTDVDQHGGDRRASVL